MSLLCCLALKNFRMFFFLRNSVLTVPTASPTAGGHLRVRGWYVLPPPPRQRTLCSPVPLPAVLPRPGVSKDGLPRSASPLLNAITGCRLHQCCTKRTPSAPLCDLCVLASLARAESVVNCTLVFFSCCHGSPATFHISRQALQPLQSYPVGSCILVKPPR